MRLQWIRRLKFSCAKGDVGKDEKRSHARQKMIRETEQCTLHLIEMILPLTTLVLVQRRNVKKKQKKRTELTAYYELDLEINRFFLVW